MSSVTVNNIEPACCYKHGSWKICVLTFCKNKNENKFLYGQSLCQSFVMT